MDVKDCYVGSIVKRDGDQQVKNWYGVIKSIDRTFVMAKVEWFDNVSVSGNPRLLGNYPIQELRYVTHVDIYKSERESESKGLSHSEVVRCAEFFMELAGDTGREALLTTEDSPVGQYFRGKVFAYGLAASHLLNLIGESK